LQLLFIIWVGLKGIRDLNTSGEIHVVKGIDPNFWSYFEALGIVKEFKYGVGVKIW